MIAILHKIDRAILEELFIVSIRQMDEWGMSIWYLIWYIAAMTVASASFHGDMGYIAIALGILLCGYTYVRKNSIIDLSNIIHRGWMRALLFVLAAPALYVGHSGGAMTLMAFYIITAYAEVRSEQHGNHRATEVN